MGLFNNMREPVFLKESNNAQNQLAELKKLRSSLNEEGKMIIDKEIKQLEYGIIGEQNIAFELKNSHMPMYVLHDVCFSDGELDAQIDYLVFTRKLCFVIECKNLYGNIEIDKDGNFIRYMKVGNKYNREGIYSPITQNKRHIELMKKIARDNRKYRITKFLTDKAFESSFQSVVVLSNPKTVLNAKYAPKYIKDHVIRIDNLIAYMQKMNAKISIASANSDKNLLSWAESFLKADTDMQKDYTEKYKQYIINNAEDNISEEEEVVTFNNRFVTEENNIQDVEDNNSIEEVDSVEDTEIFKELKAYRLKKSREEKVKPYFIYNNKQIKFIITRKPQTKDELKKIYGFGDIKVDKYGEDIISIVKKYLYN